jgi:hypothetical protein
MIAHLVEAHPALFRGRVPPHSELPEGWYAMANAVCTAIESTVAPEELRVFNIRQIVVEAGTLRIRPSGMWTGAVAQLIQAVEKISALTCMECGSPGRRREGEKRLTLCDFCEEERQIRKCRHQQSRST